MALMGIKNFLLEIQKLPKDLQRAIVSVKFLEELHNIQKEKSLHIDQAAALEEITFRLMLGEIEIEDYSSSLAKALHIDPQQASEYTDTINKRILDPIRNKFQEIQYEEEEEDEEDAILNAPVEKKEITSNLQTKEITENHEDLSHADILAEIENPSPSTVALHEVFLPTSTGMPTAPTIVNPPKEISAAGEVTAPAVGAVISTEIPIVVAPTTPTVNTEPSLVTALQNKLGTQTVNQPQEIKHSLDPYKEPLI